MKCGWAFTALGLTSLVLCLACGGDGEAPADGNTGGNGGAGGTPYTGPYEDNLVPLKRMDGSTFVEILEVRTRDDGVLLFCSGVRGMTMVDISTPEALAQIGILASSQGSSQYPRCQHIADAGATVYMSNRGDEIQPTPFITAFDFTQSPPQETVSYVEPGVSFEGIAASGDMLYAAVHDNGVRVLQNTGAAIQLVGTLTGLQNAWGVAIDGTTLYIADGTGGLKIADVSQPASPVVVGNLAIAGPAQFVEIDRDRNIAYVAAGATGVVIVDVSDPAAPVELATFDTPGSALQVALEGDHLFIADWNDARVIDVADPAAPVLIATEHIFVPDFPRVLGIGALGDAAFIGEWTGLYSYRFMPERTASDIRLADLVIDLGNVAAGEQRGVAILTTNEGPRPLNIVDMTLGAGLIPVTTVPVIIEPGETVSIEVGVLGSDSGINAPVSLFSDDPDEFQLDVAIRANSIGIGVGDPAPNVAVDLVSGGSWTLASQSGNVVVLTYFATF